MFDDPRLTEATELMVRTMVDLAESSLCILVFGFIGHTWKVMPKSGSTTLDGATGAFSNVLCLALDKAECRRLVDDAFATLDLSVKRVKHVKRVALNQLDDHWKDIADHLSEANPVVVDTLYTYKKEE